MSRLKEIRESSGLSQSKLAEEMNISIRTLQAYEQNQRDLAGAKLETILKACTSLKCSLEDMFRTEAELFKLLEKYKKQQQ
jgi:transcriptional regulator with XRE-family HTH domain